MLTKQSDAGRNANWPHEHNDCTVVALSHAVNIPYDEAHKLAQDAGRRYRHGMKPKVVVTMLGLVFASGKAQFRKLDVIEPTRDLNPNLPSVQAYRMYGRLPRRKGITVAAFLRTLPKRGRFYLTCTTHAFAYVDGVVVDNLGRPMTRATMKMAYEVLPFAPAPVDAPPAAPTQAAAISQAQVNELWERLNKLEGKS